MSGANSTPLGRMNPAIGAGKKPSASSHSSSSSSSSSSSLLKPSYIMGEDGNSRSRNLPSHLQNIVGAEGIAAAVAAAAQAAAAAINASVGHKRDHDDDSNHSSKDDSAAEARKRRRKSRWQGDEKDKTFIPGMPTVLPSNMSDDQEEAYLLQLQIEEFSRRLRANDLGIPPNPEDRLASLILLFL